MYLLLFPLNTAWNISNDKASNVVLIFLFHFASCSVNLSIKTNKNNASLKEKGRESMNEKNYWKNERSLNSIMMDK